MASNNKTIFEIEDKKAILIFQKPGVQEQDFPLEDAFPYDRDGTGATYLYNVRVKADSGIISSLNGPDHNLGVFVRLDVY